ncbi:MAG: hypothetical protein JAY75_20140 [Candidatus Thiodiazotropha taylori]|nr:hypothetical protein [Candidatus Thiodiazotropha taylori]MCW4310529.1 hypothetical protein [Candidatus Thiodiazotropha endolucinida]
MNEAQNWNTSKTMSSQKRQSAHIHFDEENIFSPIHNMSFQYESNSESVYYLDSLGENINYEKKRLSINIEKQ